jgi:hypothetical protein
MLLATHTKYACFAFVLPCGWLFWGDDAKVRFLFPDRPSADEVKIFYPTKATTWWSPFFANY